MANYIWVNIAVGHQAITWINVDLWSVWSSDIYLRVISQEIPQQSISKIGLKVTSLKFHSNLSGANELSKLMPLTDIS